MMIPRRAESGIEHFLIVAQILLEVHPASLYNENAAIRFDRIIELFFGDAPPKEARRIQNLSHG